MGLDILLIDSTVAGAPHGKLDAPTLSWLDESLGASTTRPALLFLHHPPFDGIAYTDARAAPKLRRACRSSWTPPARTADRCRTCSVRGPARPPADTGRNGGRPRIRTTLAGGFQDRASSLPFARMASRTGIRKHGYSPRACRGVSRALFLRLRRNDPAPL